MRPNPTRCLAAAERVGKLPATRTNPTRCPPPTERVGKLPVPSHPRERRHNHHPTQPQFPRATGEAGVAAVGAGTSVRVVRERLKRWFGRPGPDSSDAGRLRWVRRISLGMALLTALMGARRLLTGESFAIVLLASALLLLLSAALLTPAIRSTERREREPG